MVPSSITAPPYAEFVEQLCTTVHACLPITESIMVYANGQQYGIYIKLRVKGGVVKAQIHMGELSAAQKWRVVSTCDPANIKFVLYRKLGQGAVAFDNITVETVLMDVKSDTEIMTIV